MSQRSLMARWFVIGGLVLGGLGLILWVALPIKMSFPPYLFTALLALIYGGTCLQPSRSRATRKP